jgi:D-glycero-D-manno-heptose 1,7-bisphosphate phosphatase
MLPGPEEIPVFVLCGGLGTRLRNVDARPKAVIPIVRLPFLFYFLRLIGLQGFRNVHLLVGHGAEGVLTALGLGDGPSPLGEVERSILEPLTLRAHREETPQGTGGALRLARDSFGELNLIANADSYAEVVYRDLIDAHALSNDRTREGITLLGVWQEERKDYGGLQLEDHPHRAQVGSPQLKIGAEAPPPSDSVVRMRTYRVTQFLEKGITGEGWINGGVYLAGCAALDRLPDGPSSLERELLPDLARESLLHAMTCRCFFRDIGTPERLKRAEQEFRWIRARF